MQIRAFQIADEPAVISLWETCGLTRAWNNPHADIARKLTEQPELFLVGVIDDSVMASVMIGFDGHRGWVYYLAVAPSHRELAYGRALMGQAEALLLARGCPKINLMVRSTNAALVRFYAALGYTTDDVITLGKRLITD